MSQENVQVVRRVNAAIDANDMDALVAEFHPDVEIVVCDPRSRGRTAGMTACDGWLWTCSSPISGSA